MKLSIAQALGTVLNIQVALVRNTFADTADEWFVIRDPSGDMSLDIGLGKRSEMTLDQAVWKAAQTTDFAQECHFAIFPMGSNREDFYMAIEREMLRQEASQEFGGKKMWEQYNKDPRDLINTIMEQIRECATTLIHPPLFQSHLLRVGVLVIAGLQWTNDWIGRLRLRQSVLASGRQPEPEVVPFAEPVPPSSEPPTYAPPIFGNPSLSVVEETEKKGMIEVAKDLLNKNEENMRNWTPEQFDAEAKADEEQMKKEKESPEGGFTETEAQEHAARLAQEENN